tara:strand:- start:80 stop:274 length:195 start_codon:yes stop_codon:yes gene_type:complete
MEKTNLDVLAVRDCLLGVFIMRAATEYDGAVRHMETVYPELWKLHAEHIQQFYDFEIKSTGESK